MYKHLFIYLLRFGTVPSIVVQYNQYILGLIQVCIFTNSNVTILSLNILYFIMEMFEYVVHFFILRADFFY